MDTYEHKDIDHIITCLLNDQRLEAIKRYRNISRLGLKEAKDFCDFLYYEQNRGYQEAVDSMQVDYDVYVVTVFKNYLSSKQARSDRSAAFAELEPQESAYAVALAGISRAIDLTPAADVIVWEQSRQRAAQKQLHSMAFAFGWNPEGKEKLLALPTPSALLPQPEPSNMEGYFRTPTAYCQDEEDKL